MRGIGIGLSWMLFAACGGDDCPPGTESKGGRCVGGGDADSDSDTCGGTTWYRDADGDGYGDDADIRCDEADGWVDVGGDCADDDRAIHPMAQEVCNGLDDDCADGPDTGAPCVLGATDAACTTTCGTPGTGTCAEGCVVVDCAATEQCNGIDDDCNDLVDDGLWELSPAVQVSTDPGEDVAPDLAYVGGAWFVVWEDAAGTYNAIRYASIADDVVEPAGGEYMPPAPTSDNFRPRVATMGGDLVLGFNNEGGVALGCILDAADPVADQCVPMQEFGVPPFITPSYTSGLAASPTVVAMGFVSDVSRGLPFDVSVGLFDATPASIATDRVVGIAATDDGPVSVAYDAADDLFAIAWASGGDVWVGQMNDVGSESDSDEAVAADTGAGDALYGPAIAWGDDGGLVAYVRASGGGHTLEVVALNSGANATGDPVVLGPSGPAALVDRPLDLEWAGGSYVVSFFDSVSAGTSVARVTASGQPFDGITEVSPDGALVQTSAVAWSGGTEVGLAWVDDSAGNSDIWFARYGCE